MAEIFQAIPHEAGVQQAFNPPGQKHPQGCSGLCVCTPHVPAPPQPCPGQRDQRIWGQGTLPPGRQMSTEILHWKVVLSELRQVTEWFPAAKAILTQEGATFVIVPPLFFLFWYNRTFFLTSHRKIEMLLHCRNHCAAFSLYFSSFLQGRGADIPHRSHTNPPP